MGLDPYDLNLASLASVKRLRAGALAVARTVLCTTCAPRFAQLAIRSLAHHFGFPLAFGDPARRRAVLREAAGGVRESFWHPECLPGRRMDKKRRLTMQF